jgi:hypothetical protein
MRQAMAAQGDPEDVVAAIFPPLSQLARHMVNASEDVPREPLGDVRLD